MTDERVLTIRATTTDERNAAGAYNEAVKWRESPWLLVALFDRAVTAAYKAMGADERRERAA